MIEYLPAAAVASSTSYVIGHPVKKSGTDVLTVADLEDDPLFRGSRRADNTFDDPETRAIEADTVLYDSNRMGADAKTGPRRERLALDDRRQAERSGSDARR